MTNALIGREFQPKWNVAGTEIIKLCIKTANPLLMDFHQKQHTFIVAKSGGGKSYLAGVFAEELIRTVENYAVLIVDPMGIFTTLNRANDPLEIREWNSQLPGPELAPEKLTNYEVWIPAGDQEQFDPSMYNRIFSMKAKDFSYGTFCYAFDMDVLDPQVNLFRKVQNQILKQNPEYSIRDLRIHLSESDANPQTRDALMTRIDALIELGILTEEGIDISEMLQEGKVVVFDLSMSSTYTAKILVNFLAEKILMYRKKIMKLVNQAKIQECMIEKPTWYIPPTQFLLDEAHNFLPKNAMLKKTIKEGRNCGVMMTAISQSPDLTRDVYANITHLFVGPLVFDDDINAVKAMIPVEKNPKEFRKEIKELTTGCFQYYNIDKKIEKSIRVRPRRTLHPASTTLEDENKYLYDKNASDLINHIRTKGSIAIAEFTSKQQKIIKDLLKKKQIKQIEEDQQTVVQIN